MTQAVDDCPIFDPASAPRKGVAARDLIFLNERRQRVGRLIFGDDWIDGLTDEQYELLRQYAPALRAIVRTDGVTNPLPHVAPCPTGFCDRLDRALGRQFRMEAQYVTVDSWLQDHGFDSVRPSDRKSFNALIKAEAKARASAPIERQRGPKATILPRIIAAMKDDISSGQLTLDALKTMSDKEMEAKYEARRERVRAARQTVLATAKK
jgi:hypothetical protein